MIISINQISEKINHNQKGISMICPNKFICEIIAHHRIHIIATSIWTRNLIFGESHFISSIIAIIHKNIAQANNACISLNLQYVGKRTIILIIVAKIKKIHISLGTGVFLVKSLYFHGVSKIHNFLNNLSHMIAMIKLIIIDRINTFMFVLFM